MFHNAKRRASRIGSVAVKTLISVDILSINLASRVIRSSEWDDSSLLSVCLERGGKISATNNVTVTKKDLLNSVRQDLEIPCNETVEVIATLYKVAKSGSYQEKSCKLVLRKLKKNARFGLDTYQGLGRFDLKLHDLAAELGYEQSIVKRMNLPLELLPGCSLSVLIKIRMMKQSAAGDDTMSLASGMSGQSDSSTLGASFYHEGSAKSPVFDATRYDVTSIHEDHDYGYEDTAAAPEAAPEAVPETADRPIEAADLLVQAATAVASGDETVISSEEPHSSSEGLTPTERQALETTGQLPEVDPKGVSVSIRAKHNRRRIGYNDGQQTHEDVYNMYQKELEAKSNRLNSLEAEYTSYREQATNELAHLTSENARLEHRLRSEVEARAIFQAANSQSDDEIAKMLADAREHSNMLASEYEKTAVTLSLATHEINRLKEQLERALEEKVQETKATQDAATVAVKACLRRAQLDEENDELLNELIDMKVQFANVSMDCDYERRKAMVLKKTLQYYAEKMAALEVKYVNADQDEQKLDGVISV